MHLNILVVDDEPILREDLRAFLAQRGHRVRAAADGRRALALLDEEEADLVITDLRMPGLDGLELLERVQTDHPGTLVIVLTAYASVENAIEALRRGAADYLLKPLEYEELELRVRRLAELREIQRENQLLKRQLHLKEPDRHIVARSEVMQEVLRTLDTVAASEGTVLILGPSGTGKELVARAIHARSPRREGRFVAINLAAVPETLLESELFGHRKGSFTGAIRNKEGLMNAAQGGTLFLDEISEVPLHLQVKLLRAIEEREVQPVGAIDPQPLDLRLIAATNRNLEEMVERGQFRQDLYYRLNVVEIRLPALSEREEDIPPLVEHFIRKHSRDMKKPVRAASPEVLRLFRRHRWRGNVRELENAVERAMIFCDGDTLLPEHLSSQLVTRSEDEGLPDALKEAVHQFERRHILRQIELAGGDKPLAAQRLEISLSSLYRKLEE
ncbi:MAG: sigma-54 dependent transcriptional regulator [bacterium]|jgi:two-component system response regulator PilR (NtrC family)|nr:sigma-54 dependent transcriptional regulator [bacterium]